jgi:hypothetical protein
MFSNINQQNTNVYNSGNMNEVYNYEIRNMTQNINNASNGPQTGVIPNQGFNQKILNQNNTTNPINNVAINNINLQPENNMNYVSSLSGEKIPISDFQHNNMVPFFSGNSKQNTNYSTNSTIMEKYTGTSDLHKQKNEVKNFGDITSNNGFVNGMPSFTSQRDIHNRFIPSQNRTNELPFEQLQVGPGIGQGYTSSPSGGYNQANKRDYILPKTSNELRVASKPMASELEGRLNPGFLRSGTRGRIGTVNKNRVNRFYKNTPDMYLRTGGSVRAAALRDKFYMKPNNRRYTRSYYGALGPGDHSKSYKTSAYRKSRKHNYMNPSPRNAYNENGWIITDSALQNGVGDYSRSSIENKPNERDITQKRTVIHNLTTEIKKLTTPLQDFVRRTRKENFIGNVRPEGNMKAAMPPKITVKDPDDIARTTIKETTIHNTHDGFLSGNKKQIVYDPSDVARTTIKETNIHHNAPYINMAPQQPTNLRVYDPDDVPMTTMKETSIHNDHYGFVENSNLLNPGAYTTSNYKMRNTNKQFTSDHEYTGIANGDTETGGGRGYLTSRYKAKNTHKQFLSNYEYKGHAGYYNEKPTSYSDMYNARTNPNKEEIAVGRSPTKQGAKISVGEDLVNVQFKKLETDRINLREPSETSVYQAPPQTNRCGLTTMKDKLQENTQRSRMDLDILNAFNNNPYTQSLSSAV